MRIVYVTLRREMLAEKCDGYQIECKYLFTKHDNKCSGAHSAARHRSAFVNIDIIVHIFHFGVALSTTWRLKQFTVVIYTSVATGIDNNSENAFQR